MFPHLKGVHMMKVAQIWRYPGKSMGGEQRDRAHIGSLGIEGDRVAHEEDARHYRTL
jgi:uncharacterized protein YcbX